MVSRQTYEDWNFDQRTNMRTFAKTMSVHKMTLKVWFFSTFIKPFLPGEIWTNVVIFGSLFFNLIVFKKKPNFYSHFGKNVA